MSDNKEKKHNRRHELNRELHAAFLSGDESALEQLIYKNKGLASIMVRKYRWTLEIYKDIEVEDLNQAALIGIWQAVVNWKPDIGALSTLAFWYASKEIQKMIYKRQTSRNNGYLTAEVLTTERIPGADGLTVGDTLKDNKTLPDDVVLGYQRCNEFFQQLEEFNSIPADVEALKDFVYNDWPPKDPKTFTRIKNLIQTSTQTRGWVQQWMDDNTNFIRSQAFDKAESSRSSSGSYNDPTASAVLHRERLENKLERLLGGI